ncbi:hypothetical protein [Neobacillus notoginsengisoli]|uniref:hypothetical protein n=1 Tax=Neobacillus notoginsengisoli TaxID=1578198 RepID=UPI001F01F955|nr:hypothetical protein [Neobacillus notoginsengisoli]
MKNVLEYEEALGIDFGQASICLDACFILAFLDSNDFRGDAVGNLMAKWQADGVEKIGIPYQVHSEVIHNLFKNNVIKALVAAKKFQLNQIKSRKIKYSLTEEERLFGGQKVTQDLLRFAPMQTITEIINGRRASVPVSNILKEYKKIFPKSRPSLTSIYKSALDKMNQFISTLTNDFGFKVEWLVLDQNITDIAESYMTLFQLEIFDAMHLASSQYNYYHYFATLDRDFVHTLYDSEKLTLKIVNIA